MLLAAEFQLVESIFLDENAVMTGYLAGIWLVLQRIQNSTWNTQSHRTTSLPPCVPLNLYRPPFIERERRLPFKKIRHSPATSLSNFQMKRGLETWLFAKVDSSWLRHQRSRALLG